MNTTPKTITLDNLRWAVLDESGALYGATLLHGHALEMAAQFIQEYGRGFNILPLDQSRDREGASTGPSTPAPSNPHNSNPHFAIRNPQCPDPFLIS